MPSIRDIIAATPDISARPDSVAVIMGIIEDPEISADKLVPVVQRDPGLTAGLLRLCNSPLYGLRRTIATPREALVMVGNLTFARLCFTLSLEPVIHRDLPGYALDYDTLWQHSLATAYGAAFLEGGMGLDGQRERAFTAGLLHDIGKLVLDAEIAHSTDDNGGHKSVTLDFERRFTGFDHAEAGAALLDSWHIPEVIVEAIRWHHEPLAAGANKRLALAVDIANCVSHVAVEFQTRSLELEEWVASTFEGSAFALSSVQNLAEAIALKHENILALAMNPRS